MSDGSISNTQCPRELAPQEAHPNLERRQEERTCANGRTLYVLVDDALHAFYLRNISSHGVMGSTTIGLAAPENIRLRFENGTLVPAAVKWSRGALTGLSFPSPVPPELISVKRQRQSFAELMAAHRSAGFANVPEPAAD